MRRDSFIIRVGRTLLNLLNENLRTRVSGSAEEIKEEMGQIEPILSSAEERTWSFYIGREGPSSKPKERGDPSESNDTRGKGREIGCT